MFIKVLWWATQICTSWRASVCRGSHYTYVDQHDACQLVIEPIIGEYHWILQLSQVLSHKLCLILQYGTLSTTERWSHAGWLVVCQWQGLNNRSCGIHLLYGPCSRTTQNAIYVLMFHIQDCRKIILPQKWRLTTNISFTMGKKESHITVTNACESLSSWTGHSICYIDNW